MTKVDKEEARGYKGADTCIKKGEDPEELRRQASSDIETGAFGRGWKKRCDEEIESLLLKIPKI
jgi:hypothetical protein